MQSVFVNLILMDSQPKVIHVTYRAHLSVQLAFVLAETHMSSSTLQNLSITVRECSYHHTAHSPNTWNTGFVTNRPEYKRQLYNSNG